MAEKEKVQEAPKNEVAKRSNAEQFVEAVKQKFTQEMSTTIAFDDYRRRLAQHLFLSIDTKMKEYEIKRSEKNDNSKPAYTWQNIDMQKLALDSVNRVNLGLDAALPNHLHIIPYLNNRTGKYALDLQVGFEGLRNYRMKVAVEKPLDVIVQLVYDTDEFEPLMKDSERNVESYKFKVTNPFKRGKVIGGFAYIIYENPIKNKLVIVSEDEFIKTKAKAKSNDFWDKFPDDMRKKTVVRRAMKEVPIDPESVYLESISRVEAEMDADVDHVQANINQSANTKKLSFTDFQDVEAVAVEEPTPDNEEDPGF